MMNDHNRQHLILKLTNKQSALQQGLDCLRNEFKRPDSHLGEIDSIGDIRAEVELIARWIEDFTTFALRTAKSISRDEDSLSIVVEHVRVMLERFDPLVKNYVNMLHRNSQNPDLRWYNEKVGQDYRRARSNVSAQLAEAKYEFTTVSITLSNTGIEMGAGQFAKQDPARSTRIKTSIAAPRNRQLDHDKIIQWAKDMLAEQPSLSKGAAAMSIIALLGAHPRTGKPRCNRHIERMIGHLWGGYS